MENFKFKNFKELNAMLGITHDDDLVCKSNAKQILGCYFEDFYIDRCMFINEKGEMELLYSLYYTQIIKEVIA